AASTKDEKIRRRALTFVFVGGGFAGVEAIAELEDMARDACKIYPNVSPEDMRWVMVEGSGRILPEVRPALGEYTVRELEKRGIEPRDYKHKHVGSVASLGLHKGVADVYNVRLRGWPAWFMHRTYHMSRVPTLNRKVRVIADWTLALFFRREAVGMGAIERPR